MDKIYDAMVEHLCQMASRAGYFNGDVAEARAYYATASYDHLCNGRGAGFRPQRNTFACWGEAKVLSRLERHVATIQEARRRNESPELSPRVVAYYRRHLHTV